MTPELVLMGGGIALLILAAMGGGVEAKEIKIPPISTKSRFLSAIAGMFLVVLGLEPKLGALDFVAPLMDKREEINPSRQAILNAVDEEPIVFFILDKLGADQIEERISVYIDGAKKGEIVVNKDSPIAN